VSGTTKNGRPDPSGLIEPGSLPECLLWGLVCFEEVIFNSYGLSALFQASKAILGSLNHPDPQEVPISVPNPKSA